MRKASQMGWVLFNFGQRPQVVCPALGVNRFQKSMS